MAETLRKLIEKKRFHSSSSEESSPPRLLPHDRKKPRNENAHVHEGENRTLSDSEMTDILDGKLQEIITKLEKLDATKSQLRSSKKRYPGWTREFIPWSSLKPRPIVT